MSVRLGAILVTSAARKTPLLSALRNAAHRVDSTSKIIAADSDVEAPCRYVADEFWAMPRLEGLNIVDFQKECRAREIFTVLPTRDGELNFWAGNRVLLENEGITVIVSKLESISLCLDKLSFAKWGQEHGFSIIPAALNPEQFRGGPLVVKERFGAGSKLIGLRLTESEALAHSRRLHAPIFQPFVEGLEISIDAWLTRNGRVHGLVLRRRNHVISGESQITTTFRDPRIEEQAREVLERIGLSGPVVMQGIVTDLGLEIIEVNPRFGGASTASIAVGLDLLYWSLLERVSPTSTLPAFERKLTEIRQIRIPKDIIVNDFDI